MTQNQTPLMIQYQSIKEQHQNEILFFRLGDFYEMFNDDAIEVSRLLNLTLTHRNSNPMCGIPYHASKVYIARLLRMGKKIAICEQLSLPQGKGLAERKVIEIITPGTAVDEEYLDCASNNYLSAFCCVKKNGKEYASFSFIDISTGAFHATHWPFEQTSERLPKELGRVAPKEFLVDKKSFQNHNLKEILDLYPEVLVSEYGEWLFDLPLSYKKLIKHFDVVSLQGFSLDESSPEVATAGFLIDYLSKMSSSSIPHVRSISVYEDSQYMMVDESSRKNLEIITNLRDNTTQYTVYDVLNSTVTPMGNRMLRSWLMFPLKDSEKIRKRQEEIKECCSDARKMTELRETLSNILDVERLASRIAMDRAHAKDLIAMKNSLSYWKSIRNLDFLNDVLVSSVEKGNEIIEIIEKSIIDDPSIVLNEGNLIKRGFDEQLDHLNDIQNNFNDILDEYLEEEKQKTSMNNLKIRQSRNDGYYIEVTKGNVDSVPSHFIKKRSLTNNSRYTTEKLLELEKELVTATEQIIERERQLFLFVRGTLKNYLEFISDVSFEIAKADTISSLAYTALTLKWNCPLVDDSDAFEIIEGRHPVVEKHIPSGEFVPNDVCLNEKSFALITGPNMAGKSTFLRQNAIITLLAQIGSFVPAAKAHIGIVDKIFCRVGASDNLAKGESTFLVEMSETAHILNSATSKSLIIMDEIGRGTSTEDGLSIAWAVSEYLLNKIKAKTLFATHYHELTDLEHPNLKLLCLEVREYENKIVFLKKIKEGATENSYGIHVAHLAGIPDVVVSRAETILKSLHETDDKKSKITEAISNHSESLSLFSEEELILNDILSCNTDEMTPLAALQKISEWKKTLFTK